MALIEKLNKATGGDTSKISDIIGDAQANQAAAGLMQEIKKYTQIKDAAFASLGMTEQEYARMSKGSEANFNKMKSAMNALVLTVGAKLLPTLTVGVEWLTRTINAVSAWAKANPGTTNTILALVGGLASFKIGLGILRFAFGSILGPFATFYGWWQKFKILKEAGTFAAAFGKMRGVISFFAQGLMRGGPVLFKMFDLIRTGALFLARGVMRAGLMMLTNPMIAVIVGIVAVLGFAGYMIYKHWDKIHAAFVAAGAWLSGLGQTFMGYGRALLDGLVNGISSRVTAVKSMILGIGQKVAGWFRGVLGIHSPSRVFMGFGGFITDGLALGIERGGKDAARAAASLAALVAAAGAPAETPLAPRAFARTSLAAAGAGAGAGSPRGVSAQFGPVSITIHAAPGQSPQDIAQAVAAELDRRARQAAASLRSSYVDD